jgi:hypothetical protein
MTAGLGGGQNPGYRPVIFVSYHRGAVHLYFVVVYNEKQAWLRKIRAATRKISAPLPPPFRAPKTQTPADEQRRAAFALIRD